MSDAHPVTIPMDKHQELNVSMHKANGKEQLRAPNRKAVGSLMYLAVLTRPDIAFALSSVSQHLEKPNKIQWNAVKRILKYLKSTQDYELLFPDCELNITVYSDADFTNDTQTRRSVSGILVKLGEITVCWCLQKQKMVTLSTTEAEFVAAMESNKNLILLSELVKEISVVEFKTPKLVMDN